MKFNLPFFNRKPDQPTASFDMQAFHKLMTQYNLSEGVAIPIPDKPESYINDGYAGNGDVYSIITKINNMSKQGRIKLVQKKLVKGEWIENEVFGHPLNEFLYFVNPNMSFQQFWTATHIFKLAVGNSYWFKPTLPVGINKGKTLEIHLMPAQFVEIVPGDWLNPVRGYQLNFTPVIEIEKPNVYHQKFFDPRYDMTFFMYGLSPIKAAAQTVAKLNQAEVTEQKAFENSAPPYILFKKNASGMTEYAGLTKEQQIEMRKMLNEYSQDAKKGKPIVTRFEPGIINLGVSPVDLGIVESSQAGMRKLCNIYNFPSVLMNDTANSTYNNMGSARLAAWTDCLLPLNREFATDLTFFLTNGIKEYEDYYFVYDTSEVEELQASMDTKVTWMKSAGWSKNEIRQATGKAKVDNPIMDEPIFQSGEIPLSEMSVDLEKAEKDFVDYLVKE